MRKDGQRDILRLHAGGNHDLMTRDKKDPDPARWSGHRTDMMMEKTRAAFRSSWKEANTGGVKRDQSACNLDGRGCFLVVAENESPSKKKSIMCTSLVVSPHRGQTNPSGQEEEKLDTSRII